MKKIRPLLLLLLLLIFFCTWQKMDSLAPAATEEPNVVAEPIETVVETIIVTESAAVPAETKIAAEPTATAEETKNAEVQAEPVPGPTAVSRSDTKAVPPKEPIVKNGTIKKETEKLSIETSTKNLTAVDALPPEESIEVVEEISPEQEQRRIEQEQRRAKREKRRIEQKKRKAEQMQRRIEQEQKRAQRKAEQERRKAEQTQYRIEQEQQKSEQEQRRIEKEQRKIEQEKRRAEQEEQRAQRKVEQEQQKVEQKQQNADQKQRKAEQEQRRIEKEQRMAEQEKRKIEQEQQRAKQTQARLDRKAEKNRIAQKEESKAAVFELLEAETIEFDPGKSTLTAKGKETVDKLAVIFNRYPEVKIEIAGHADSDGDKVFNQALSQSRVDSVKKELVLLGVADERLTAKGYGESKPLVSNATDDNKQKNRRVEIIIIGE